MPDTRVIAATTYYRKMKGGAQSHLVLASDGRCYVVKSLDNPQHERVLVNEWIAGHLATEMGLSVPHKQLVEVSPSFTDLNPQFGAELGGKLYSYRSGICFGSQFAGGMFPGRTVDLLPLSSLRGIKNIDEFVGALVFDKWTCYADARQAVFTRLRTASSFQVFFIDHGYSFNGDAWVMKDAPLRGCYGNRHVYSALQGWVDIERWLERMWSISEKQIWDIAASVPPEWCRGFELRLVDLMKTLLKRRHRVGELILSLKAAQPNLFPSWP